MLDPRKGVRSPKGAFAEEEKSHIRLSGRLVSSCLAGRGAADSKRRRAHEQLRGENRSDGFRQAGSQTSKTRIFLLFEAIRRFSCFVNLSHVVNLRFTECFVGHF